MTETDTTDSPFGAVFEMQREMIDQSQALLEESASVPTEVADRSRKAAGGTADATEQVPHWGKHLVMDVLDTVEETTPIDEESMAELRASVEDGFDELVDLQAEATDAGDELAEDSIDAADTVVGEALDGVDEQLETLLTASEDINDRTIATLSNVVEQFESLQQDLQATGESVADETSEEIEHFGTDLEERLDQYEATVSDLATQVDSIRADIE